MYYRNLKFQYLTSVKNLESYFFIAANRVQPIINLSLLKCTKILKFLLKKNRQWRCSFIFLSVDTIYCNYVGLLHAHHVTSPTRTDTVYPC